MNDIQRKQIELLKEIDTLCRNNDINYVLSGGIAFDASYSKKFSQFQYDCSICMTCENIQKFFDVFEIEKKDNRYIECIERNGNYKSYDIKYVDKNSTYFPMLDNNNEIYHGIYVRIIRCFPKYNSKICNKVNSCIIKCFECADIGDDYKCSKIIKLIARLYKKIEKIFGKSKLCSIIVRSLSKNRKNDKENNYIIRRYGNKNILLPKSLVNFSVDVNFENCVFKQSYNPSLLINKIYEKKINNILQITKNNNYEYLIFDSSSNLSDYIDVINTNNINKINKDINNIKKETIFLQKQYKNYINIVKKACKITDIKSELMKNKNKIKELYNNGDYNNLSLLLEDYYKELKNDNNLIIDEEINKIALECSHKCGVYSLENDTLNDLIYDDKQYVRKNIFLKLLCEIDSICNEFGLLYVINRKTALEAYNNSRIHPDDCYVSIAMNWKDSKLLKKIIKKRYRNRMIEGIEDCPSFSSMALRYSDISTTSINSFEIGSLNSYGMFVEIERFRSKSKNKIVEKCKKAIEKVLFANSCMQFKKINCKIGKTLLPRVFIKLLVTIFYMEPFFKTNRLIITRFPKGSKTFDSSVLYNRKQIYLNGNKLYCSNNITNYLKTEFGKSFNNKVNYMNNENGHITFIDETKPYNYYYDSIIKDFLKNNIYKDRRGYYVYKYYSHIKQKRIKKYWNILFRTDDRFHLWQKYYPIKNELMSLYKNKEMGRLRLELDEHILITEKYLQKNMGICCDKDIQFLVNEIYKFEGKSKMVKRINHLIPKQYRNNIYLKG